MAGREFLGNLIRRTSHPVVALTILVLLLTAVGATGMRRTLLPRLAQVFSAKAAVVKSGQADRARVDRSTFTRNTATTNQTSSERAVIGEYIGSFDATKNTFEIVEQKSGGAQNEFRTEGDGTSLPAGSFTFKYLNRAFITGGTVSMEIEVGNTNSTHTFYNTRLIFTDFKNGSSSGSAASNSPTSGGLAFYNDGQMIAEGKLGVSRDLGDIAPNSTKSVIWTFSVPAAGPTFYFRAVILADLGVAAESVQPAAVQVTNQAGSTVKINGRGFSGTPTVDLLNSSGNVVASNLSVSNASSTSLTVAIPAGTAAGIYGLRVTNPGGTPGGFGSSRLSGRLTVTPQPTLGLTQLANGTGGTGPYLLSGGTVTINSEISVLPGTVIYVDSGTTLQLTGTGNFIANGGIPGVSGGAGIATPAQIVFTANRAPNSALPSRGAWGGINATTASNATMTMRNTVVEYGGASCSAQIDITGSGRTLRLADSIVRESLGTAVKALGQNDVLVGFTRSRIENNGTSTACDAAMQLSGNAALGLYALESTNGTSVVDGNFYYSSGNYFAGNTENVVQIGSDTNASSNDFTKSGVLVGQGDTPLQVRGSSTNPAVIGNANSPGAELAINANALIQIAPGTDLQAGTASLFGGIAANGAPGYIQVSGATPNSSSKRIQFQKTANGGNWGSIYFSPKSSPSSIMRFVVLDGGGTSNIGPGQLIIDGVNIPFTDSQSSNSSSAGFLAVNGGASDTTRSVFLNNAPVIDTIAGSHLGDGNKASLAPVPRPTSMLVDAGRGIYLVDRDPLDNYSIIRFINTSASPVIICGKSIAPGTIETIAGGGLDLVGTDNIPGTQANLDLVGGIALSNDKNLLYFTSGFYTAIRALNVSPGASLSSANPDAGAITVGSSNIRIGNVGTFFPNSGAILSMEARGLAVHPTTNDIYVVDPTRDKVFKITPAGAISTFAGNGLATEDVDPLPGGNSSPTNVPLLNPSEVLIDSTGNTIYISDSGHGRIVKVTSGSLSLVAQVGTIQTGGAGRQTLDNPYPTGMALYGGFLYFSNSNKHTIQRVVSTNNVVTIAGTTNAACDPAAGSCGDGGSPANALLNLPTHTSDIPIAGLAADSNGLFIADQARLSQYGLGRIRYINLTGASVNVAGVSVAGNTIASIAGSGLARPYNGGLAITAELFRPVGIALDNNKNLFIAESESSGSGLRFLNRGSSPVTLPDGGSGITVQPGNIAKVAFGTNTVGSTPVPISSASLGTLQGMTFVNNLGLFVVDTNAYPVSDPFFRVKAGRLYYYNTTNTTQTIYPQAGNIGANPIVVPSGHIVTIAGRTVFQDSGSSAGTSAFTQRLVGATDVAIHPITGDIYISSAYFTYNDPVVSNINGAVYKISRNTGDLTTLALPTNKRYTGLAFDSSGKLYVANHDDNTILQETGSGTGVFNNFATVSKPRDLVIDASNTVYVISSGSHQIIKISGGIATGYAGIAGQSGFSGDNGGATSAKLNLTTDVFKLSVEPNSKISMTQTMGIALGTGELIFADTGNFRIRRVR